MTAVTHRMVRVAFCTAVVLSPTLAAAQEQSMGRAAVQGQSEVRVRDTDESLMTEAGPSSSRTLGSTGATTSRSGGQDEVLRRAAREGRSLSLSENAGPDGSGVPEFHTVARGDTLWDITGSYFENPWRWPSVWGLNPQITNPHWIFPNDQVRLLRADQVVRRPTQTGDRLNLPTARVPPSTVFLRDEGFLERRAQEFSGTVVGSPEDQLLLSEGDAVYVEFRRSTPRAGEDYAVYQEGQRAAGSEDRNEGRVVRLLGTVRIETWDPDRRIAVARITESLDGIERGERVAAIPRRIEVVPPRTNEVNLRASIVATTHPRELVGAQMVVYLNRGTNDRVAVGNRFSVVRRGDAWRQSLTTSSDQITGGSSLDRDGDGVADYPPGRARADRNFPEEVVGEMIVVEVRERTSTCLVTSATRDLQVGDIAEMRRGY